jgi:hypothetical protein
VCRSDLVTTPTDCFIPVLAYRTVSAMPLCGSWVHLGAIAAAQGQQALVSAVGRLLRCRQLPRRMAAS